MKIFLPLLDNGNGSVMASFMMDHVTAFAGREVHMIRASDSHANRGMNKIANAFLESECEVWINIDADIRFRRQDVDNLLSHDLPLVYGIYPKKDDKAEPCLCTFATIPEADPVTGLAEVRRCGRGFMLVKRQLLEAMKEGSVTLHPITGKEVRGPALRYHNHGKVEWDFFPSGVVTGEFSALESKVGQLGEPSLPNLDPDGYPRREWISEDWYFCEVARKLGFPTYVDTRIALGHVGSKEYRFSADQVTRLDSHIKTWREIHGWFDYPDLYRELVAKIPDGGRFVEVGAWLGRSIGAFAEFAETAGKKIELDVVDNFQGEPANPIHEAILNVHGGSIENAFRANMEALGLTDLITVHAKPSIEAAKDFADGSIDAVFIDADHSYEAVVADIATWSAKLKTGGILCGHDVDEAGVRRAVQEIFGERFEVRGRCWVVRM